MLRMLSLGFPSISRAFRCTLFLRFSIHNPNRLTGGVSPTFPVHLPWVPLPTCFPVRYALPREFALTFPVPSQCLFLSDAPGFPGVPDWVSSDPSTVAVHSLTLVSPHTVTLDPLCVPYAFKRSKSCLFPGRLMFYLVIKLPEYN